jgi:hypothetical protein
VNTLAQATETELFDGESAITELQRLGAELDRGKTAIAGHNYTMRNFGHSGSDSSTATAASA